ncbi:hypothetical protein BH23BAC4_BH23BAC4_02180 [soil metagenome]
MSDIRSIPVTEVRSRASLSPSATAELFGKGYQLRGTERVRLAMNGQVHAEIAVRAGRETALFLDGIDAVEAQAEGLRLVGPSGSISAPEMTRLTSRLFLPKSVRSAMRVSESAALQAGEIVFPNIRVMDGSTVEFEMERAAFLAAARPTGARLVPGLALPEEPKAPSSTSREMEIEGRLITENDIRQARLKRRKIRVRQGQIVTPAALSLARELGVFE